jgi:choline-sulfatase
MPRLLALILTLIATFAQGAEPAKPDILVLFADDMAPDTIAALGNREIRTPHLDRLAARGTSFDRAYGMGGWQGAICVASRAMLLTGRTLWNCDNGKAVATDLQAGRLWPQRMAAAGYRTYFTGKWHNLGDPAKAFDEVGTVRNGGMPHTGDDAYLRSGTPGNTWSPFDRSRGGFWSGGKHWTEVTADEAAERVARAEPDEKPRFLFISFNAPHDPRQSPREFVEQYPPGKVSVPANFLPSYPHARAIGCGPDLRDERLTPHPRTPDAIRLHRAEYYAIIAHLDNQVGRILEALDKSGRADRTLVVFTSDNGLAVGQHGLMGKQSMYEHSLRVPLILAGPGIPNGKRIGTPVSLFDLMPTALELAGTKPGSGFRSLLPLLSGESSGARDALIGSYMNLQRAVILRDWKLIAYPNAGVVRLYHLAEDPLETRDLAADPRHANRRRELFRRLQELQREHGDKLDLSKLAKTL